MSTLTRRRFLGGAAVCGTTVALAPRFAFAAPGDDDQHTLVVVSLRGGMDGLSAVVPMEAGYHDRRDTIAVPDGALRALEAGFGLHPVLDPLHEQWRAGRMAIIPGSGTPTGSRSHFEETDLIEHGVGALGSPERTGWLGRHLTSRPGTGVGLPAAAISSSLPSSLSGYPSAAAISNVASFAVRGVWGADRDRVHLALGRLHQEADDLVADQARATLDTIGLLGDAAPGDILPSNGAEYPTQYWGTLLRQVAQLIRADVGLEVATVDFGGWDTHDGMGPWNGGLMRTRLNDLGAALGAFLTDVDDIAHRVTVVVVSEFGRRVAENASGGLDHGRGGMMMVFGGQVDGGIKGTWPGLGADVLDRGDVPTLVDYRHLLAEIVAGPLGNPAIDQVFPDFSPSPVGVIAIA